METTTKIMDYGDYIIQYNIIKREFEAVNKEGEVRLKAPTQDELAGKIDSAVKRLAKAAKSKAFPMQVIYKSYGDPNFATITSISEDGSVWLTYELNGEKRREKKGVRWSSNEYYPRTDVNINIVNEINTRKTTIKSLQTQITNLSQKLKDPIDIQGLTSES